MSAVANMAGGASSGAVTLADAMRSGASTELALYAADAILAVLEAGHAAGLVHLDLDPRGIQVRSDGTLKLPVLGRSSALSPAELARARFDTGRLAYVAPEVVQARPADTRSDLFSLGWLLYEWLGGRAPFAGDTPLALAMAIDGGKRTPLAELAPRVQADLCDVIEMLLRSDASCRFQTPSAARAALGAVARFDAVKARSEMAARATRQEPRTRLGLGLASLLGAPSPPSPPSLLENAFVAKASKAPDSALVAPPPLFLSSLTPEPAPRLQAPPSQVRAPRARRVEGEPVHDGRTAFLRVESALRTVLPRKWQTSAGTSVRTSARTSAPRAVVGKWQDPSTTLFRVRRAALAGPVVKVASLPRVWWIALTLGIGLPVLACIYLLCRLWF